MTMEVTNHDDIEKNMCILNDTQGLKRFNYDALLNCLKPYHMKADFIKQINRSLITVDKLHMLCFSLENQNLRL